MTDTERACLSYWYPVVKDLPFVPETRIFPHHVRIDAMQEDTKALEELVSDLQAVGEDMGGPPLFLRTGQTSGKHDWENTCAVKDLSDLKSHIRSLIFYSHAVSIPPLPHNVWVLREWLEVEHEFRAFQGLPIGREWRYFVENGRITHSQPYWPPDAIQGPSTDEWRPLLNRLNRQSDLEEAEWVARYTAARIDESKKLTGEWSVDVAKVSNKTWNADTHEGESPWYMIDMAPGEVSYRWDPKQEQEVHA